MGNIACVPQAPGGFRSSFRRKPSLKKEQNGKKKLPSFFGLDGGQERDTSTDKILQYIPAKILQKQENQKENLDQRLPSLFKRGRRKMVVRDLGKMIYYSKVKLKFQHCQEVHSCFLELFQSHLYFQSSGPNGLTYQELLPLKELQVQELGAEQSPGQQDHALHISGPLLNPLVVFCQSKAELKQWLYHLEKQIQLCGGSLALPLLSQGPGDKEELRWSVQNLPVQDWRGTQRESLGEILCLSKVKLQHLPFQEQHERLLVLYPSTLVIVSEEPGGLCFKGELPLNAIQVLFEENDKSSFLIEGRLINSIRVTCASYQDYQEWLYCLNTAQFRNADSSLSGSESFSVGSRLPQPSQLPSSVRGSLSSDGHTSSWASGGRVTALTASSGSLPDAPPFALGPEGRLLQEPLSPGYCQPLHVSEPQSQPGVPLSPRPSVGCLWGSPGMGLLQEPLSPGYCQPLHVSEPQTQCGVPLGSPEPQTQPGVPLGSPEPQTQPGVPLASPEPQSQPGVPLGSPEPQTQPGVPLGSPEPQTQPGVPLASPEPPTQPGVPLASPEPQTQPGVPLSPRPSPGCPWGSPEPQTQPGVPLASPEPPTQPGVPLASPEPQTQPGVPLASPEPQSQPGADVPVHSQPSRGSCSPVLSLQSLAVPSWPSPALPRQGLRRGSSARTRRGRGSGHGVPSQEQEHERSLCRLVPKHPRAELLSPVYQEPYCAQGTQQHPLAPLDTGTLLQCQGQPGAAQGAVPGTQQLSLEQWHCQPPPGPCTAPTYSTPGTSRRLQLRAPAQGSHLGEMCSLPQEQPGAELHPPDGPYDLADAACSCRDSSSFHDYAELQSFQSDRSYDNLWEAEEAQPGGPHVFQV